MEDQSLYDSDGSESGWDSDGSAGAAAAGAAGLLPPPSLGGSAAKARQRRQRRRRRRGVERGLAGFKRSNPRPGYAVYVLALVTFTYVMNQLNRYLLGVVARDMEEAVGFGDRKGGGYAYEALAGPVFTVCYVVVGVPLGLYADRANRRNVLVASAVVWSVATAALGAATEYWHLVLARAVQGIGEAGCTPVATSMLSDLFLLRFRGTALGVYQFGVYAGFSLSFGLGNVLKKRVGYRLTLALLAAPGVLAAALIALTVKEPRRVEDPRAAGGDSGDEGGAAAPAGYGGACSVEAGAGDSAGQAGTGAAQESVRQQLRRVMRFVCSSRSFVALCVASAVRNSAGVVWGNNAQQFYESRGLDDDTIALYMSLVPLLAGSLGAFAGGELSDRWLQTGGPPARAKLLVASQALAAPLAAGVLLAPVPWTFVLLVLGNVVGEAWIAVALAAAVDILPARSRVVGVSLFVFVNTIVGGFATLLVTPASRALGSLQGGLLLLYPGLYLASSLLFAVLHVAMRRELGDGRGPPLLRLHRDRRGDDAAAAAPRGGAAFEPSSRASDAPAQTESLLAAATPAG